MIHIATNFTARYLAPCNFGFSPVSLPPLPLAEAASIKKKAAAQQSRMIRVPLALHARLIRLRREIGLAKEKAQGYDDVPWVEQGARGVWVPIHAVIERALDDFEKHRARSNPRTTQRNSQRK